MLRWSGVPALALLEPWDPLAESSQPSGGGGWVRGAATGVSSESGTAGFHPSLWGPVPSLIGKMHMTILSHMVSVTCRRGAGQCLAQSWPLQGLPVLPLTCCPPSHLCFGSQAQERPASVLSAPSPPLADLPFKFVLALGQIRHGRGGRSGSHAE